ncbi:MAG: DUF5618 family protein [Bacteroidetes bacterium]|nr:DUF5618 family protein [Bacteroidota bacterium]
MTKAKTTENEYTIAEAYRYLANAKETLSKSPIEYSRYSDSKYVREAAGMVYLAALKALDAYLISTGIERGKLPKSIDGYWEMIRRKIPLNGKLTAALNTVYENMHVFAYYRGGVDLALVKSGFDNARKVIEMMDKLMVRTANQNIVSEPKATYKRTKNQIQQ